MVPVSCKSFDKGIFHIVVTFCVVNVAGFKVKLHIQIYFSRWGVQLIVNFKWNEHFLSKCDKKDQRKPHKQGSIKDNVIL